MSKDSLRVNTSDLVIAVSKVVDLMCPEVGEHQLQVAYLACRIGAALGLSEDDRYRLILSGALHDIGAFSLKERLDLLAFEDTKPGEHALAGYLLLKGFKPFVPIAELIKHHHCAWRNGRGAFADDAEVSPLSHILHLADRTAVRIDKKRAVLGQVPDICRAIEKQKDAVFVPAHVDALLGLSQKDYIWLEVTSDSIEKILRSELQQQTHEIDIDELLDLSRLICRLIDFKSEFTATHSSGVAATAAAIAAQIGFSENECKLMKIAAYLHDLGKLAIPSEIIEKRGKLTDAEWSVMRSHVYYTHQVLDSIKLLDMIESWSSLHQERLDGSGYPFGYKGEEMPLGAKVMAVADVFTALTEDRPYRQGMTRSGAEEILRSMAANNELDNKIVNLVLDDFDRLDAGRQAAQDAALSGYQDFRALLS